MDKDYVKATAHGSITMVDTIEKGAAFALDIHATSTATLTDKGVTSDDPKVKKTVEQLLSFLNYDGGVEIKTESDIPEDLGFGEPEAKAVSAILAVCGCLAKNEGEISEFKIDKHMSDQIIVINGKLINKKDLIEIACTSGLRFDRSYVSMYGGFVIASQKELLRKGEMETLHSVTLIPEKPQKLEKADIRVFREDLDIIFNQALSGNLNIAMRLNSILQNSTLTRDMLKAEAISVATANQAHQRLYIDS